jgi:hypothetical protein
MKGMIAARLLASRVPARKKRRVSYLKHHLPFGGNLVEGHTTTGGSC